MAEGLVGIMKQRSLWQPFVRHVVQLEPILQGMSDVGIPISLERWLSLQSLLKADMAKALEEMQALVPEPLQKIKVYKKNPTKVTAAHFQVDATLDKCTICGHKQEVHGTPAIADHEFNATVVKQWRLKLLWKPSNKALVAYMKLRAHKVPKDFQGEKDSTGHVQLARLYRETHDPMYAAVLHYRKAQTVISNHLKNWKPGPDGRVHPTFYCDPATAQLSARRPNTQNAPHHDDPEFGGYAEPFRAMVMAPPGFDIIEFDMKSAHVQTLAFEAEDADLLRIAKLDVHSFVTAHFLHLADADRLIALPDDELREKLKWIKRNYQHDRDAKVKHAFLGYDNGMGYQKLYRQYQEYFRNQAEAKKVMELFDALFPITKRYRDAICLKAHDQKYLISRYGHIRYFYEVFRVKWQKSRDGKWHEVWSHGDDHEAALCYFTQNDSHCELREHMLALESAGFPVKYNMCNTVHDSLVFLWPHNLLDRVGEVKAIMEMNSKVLVNSICPNGLSIEVEVKAGPDWAKMSAV